MKIEGIEGKEINHLLLKHGDFFLFPTSLLFTAAFTNRTLTRSSTSICCPAKELPKSTHFFFFLNWSQKLEEPTSVELQPSAYSYS